MEFHVAVPIGEGEVERAFGAGQLPFTQG
jgi:hypothetical protein